MTVAELIRKLNKVWDQDQDVVFRGAGTEVIEIDLVFPDIEDDNGRKVTIIE